MPDSRKKKYPRRLTLGAFCLHIARLLGVLYCCSWTSSVDRALLQPVPIILNWFGDAHFHPSPS
jgi:hypothetical protein